MDRADKGAKNDTIIVIIRRRPCGDDDKSRHNNNNNNMMCGLLLPQRFRRRRRPRRRRVAGCGLGRRELLLCRSRNCWARARARVQKKKKNLCRTVSMWRPRRRRRSYEHTTDDITRAYYTSTTILLFLLLFLLPVLLYPSRHVPLTMNNRSLSLNVIIRGGGARGGARILYRRKRSEICALS